VLKTGFENEKGVEGKFIRTASLIDKHADRTFNVARIDSALRDLTKRIIPVCSNFSLIIRFVEGLAFIVLC
jgi:gamma-tubulin complex component 2